MNSPSRKARAMGFAMRHTSLLNLWLWGGDLRRKNWRLRRRLLCRAPRSAMRKGLSVRAEMFRGRTVWHIGPLESRSSVRVLYWHGGGFVFGPMSIHWKFISRLVRDFGISFIVPLYPLAPDAQAPEITDFGVALYRSLVATTGADDLVMAGDSAGGMLTAVVALLAQDEGIDLPRGLVLISPGLEAVRRDDPDYPQIRQRDSVLSDRTIDELRALYAGNLSADDPRISPIVGDFTNFPPILMFAGTDDVLVLESRAFKRKWPQVEYIEGSGLFHCWPIMPVPEAIAAQNRIAQFARSVLA
ncbi:alpha/beta hydrolase [Mycobacterium sp.]|uniref:alpha/beta hydrolase n=1 Tax=Mycobacterium sp. TaxID=1785 RepID=UPI003D09F552